MIVCVSIFSALPKNEQKYKLLYLSIIQQVFTGNQRDKVSTLLSLRVLNTESQLQSKQRALQQYFFIKKRALYHKWVIIFSAAFNLLISMLGT